ncbi:hypothetical protein [Lactobacillus gallinarum]|uniref:hypothetical protein n=2 Tax=Lactobacillus TaxID=1578 RepID=UPI00195B29F6|nr:hypothetical protein [Lactobacillus gallinarum]MBM6959040.1 hypothetical protein [Lactobacillus gallinarum]
MKKRQNKTFQTFEKVTDNISYTAMSFSIFWLTFLILSGMIIRIDSYTNLAKGNDILQVLILIVILLISMVVFWMSYRFLAPKIMDIISKKLDLPISQIPDQITIIFAIIVIYVASLISINMIKSSFNVLWLPDSGSIAALSSVCMAAVAYIGNHASSFVISIIDDRGMVYNQSEEIEGEKVILWLTNVGGKTGNIKYLGWCEEKDRRDILFNGIFSGIHTFNHEKINDIITQKFEKVEPGMYTSKKQYGLSEQCRQSFI